MIVCEATTHRLLTGKFLKDKIAFGIAILKVIEDILSLDDGEAKDVEFCYSSDRQTSYPVSNLIPLASVYPW